MSSFTSVPKVEMLDEFSEDGNLRLWRLLEPFEYYRTDDPSSVIRVPVGFVTDFASIPPLLHVVEQPTGRIAKAALIHDYLYTNAIGTKKEADAIFIEACRVLGVNSFKRAILKVAVKLFGRGKYK